MSKRASSTSGSRVNGGVDTGDSFSFVNESSKTKSYSHLTVAKLKDELKRRGLSQKGLKRDLVGLSCA